MQFRIGVATAANGDFSKGIKIIEQAEQRFIEAKREFWHAVCEHALGRIFLQIVEHDLPIGNVAKNIGFIARSSPFAAKRSERHFNNAIEIAERIGSNFLTGRSHRDLADLHLSKHRPEKARNSLEKAIGLFTVCDAQTRFAEAREALSGMK